MVPSCGAGGVCGAGLDHPAIPAARIFHGRGARTQPRHPRDRSTVECTRLAHGLSPRHTLESTLVRTPAIWRWAWIHVDNPFLRLMADWPVPIGLGLALFWLAVGLTVVQFLAHH